MMTNWFTGVRQDCLVMGLEFAHPERAKFVMRRLCAHSVWAIFATLDPLPSGIKRAGRE
jgi:hypothetical protein